MKCEPRLVYLEWCDATQNDSSWRTLDEAIGWADNEKWVVKSVGWLLRETKEYLLISNKQSSESEDSYGQFGSVFKIPKTWVRNRHFLIKT